MVYKFKRVLYGMKHIRGIKYELHQWLSPLIVWMPGIVGVNLRRIFYKRLFSNCGINLNVHRGCYIREFKNIGMGNNISLGVNAQLYADHNSTIKIGDSLSSNSNIMINADCGGEIIIGDNVLIGPNVVIRASNHRSTRKDIPMAQQGHNPGKIIINNDVWLGANVVILPDVEIGKGSIIAAGAVVTNKIGEYCVAGGIPARVIKMRA